MSPGCIVQKNAPQKIEQTPVTTRSTLFGDQFALRLTPHTRGMAWSDHVIDPPEVSAPRAGRRGQTLMWSELPHDLRTERAGQLAQLGNLSTEATRSPSTWVVPSRLIQPYAIYRLS